MILIMLQCIYDLLIMLSYMRIVNNNSMTFDFFANILHYID